MLDEYRIPVGGCQKERRDVVSGRSFDVRPGGNEKIGGLNTVALSGPVQRRRTVRFRGVHIRMLREQSTNGFKVVVFDGLD